MHVDAPPASQLVCSACGLTVHRLWLATHLCEVCQPPPEPVRPKVSLWERRVHPAIERLDD